MQQSFAVSSSPHLRDNSSTRRIMLDVILALVPAGIMGVYWFGLNALLLMALCVGWCVIFECIWNLVSHQKQTIGDLSAVVTGLLLAYNLPATAPWWLTIVGSFLAIILVKQMFGGLGCNFVNPAMAARIILFVSWGTLVGSYPQAKGGFLACDAASGATPLAALNVGSLPAQSLVDMLIGNRVGVLGETCAIALLLGGVYLIVRKVITWHIPAAFIGTAFVCFALRYGAEIGLYHILSGGLLLGAIYMATDYTTSPITPIGKIIFGVIGGLALFVIRSFATYPEGCSFAILFLNVCTPLIDRLCKSKPFGEVKKHG